MEYGYLAAKAVLKPWLAAWFEWIIEGSERIPERGPAIMAFNHISYLDPFTAAYAVDSVGRRPRFLAKSELFQDKRIAWVLKGAKQIEVRRGTRSAGEALGRAFDALEEGEIIVVFPEGTITTDPDLNPMKAKSGTARLALQTGVPVIPGALWGTANVWPKGYRKHFWPPRQQLCVRIGEPLRLEGDAGKSEDWRKASAEIMHEIGVLLAGLRVVVPDRRRKKRAA